MNYKRQHSACVDIRPLWQKREKLVKDGISLMHVDQKKNVRVWLPYTAATVWTFCYTRCLLAAGLTENCISWPLLARLVIEKSWYYCIKFLSSCVHNTLMHRREWFPKHWYLGESFIPRQKCSGSHSSLGVTSVTGSHSRLGISDRESRTTGVMRRIRMALICANMCMGLLFLKFANGDSTRWYCSYQFNRDDRFTESIGSAATSGVHLSSGNKITR